MRPRILAGAVAAALLVAGGMPTLAAAPTIISKIYVVNSNGDGADLVLNGACDASAAAGLQCTLRAAIQEANNTAARDTINFDLRFGDAPNTIAPVTQLPDITQPLTINGYSQTGSSPNTASTGSNALLRVALKGPAAHVGLTALKPVTIRGLAISGWLHGIILGVDATGSVVAGNFIGTDAAGTSAAANSQDGVQLGADDVVIGGTALADRNVISGNGRYGVLIGGSSTGTHVQRNLIGVASDGSSDLGNVSEGVQVDGAAALIGGTTAAAANVIAFNGVGGVTLLASASVTARILRNSIHDNVDIGIDLGRDGVTPNDAVPDSDTGPNGLQNFPVVSSAVTAAGVTTIKGSLSSALATTYRIEFFSGPGGTSQARTFLGSKTVTTNGAGKVNWTFQPTTKVAIGKVITTTATDTAAKMTSEISAPHNVTEP